jgi:hypothetical protein
MPLSCPDNLGEYLGMNVRVLAVIAGLSASSCLSVAAPESTSAASVVKCTSVAAPYVGTLCVPPGRGSHPAILLFGGSQGGDAMSKTAANFAAHAVQSGQGMRWRDMTS